MNCFGDSDLIYILQSSSTQEKFDIYINPMLSSEEQGIIFTPHVATIYHEVKNLNYDDINAVAYTSNVAYHARDSIRESFEDGDIQFLYATPRMYFANEYFRDFVNEQVIEGNLNAIVLDDAKYLFEYGYETDKYENYQSIVDLKDLAPYQRWIVVADQDCENETEDIANILHLENTQVIQIRYYPYFFHKSLYFL
uniref:CSON013852 protein n=1 Tax=Culicoides sonorensis TaxID=179676 RepID=A0A336ML78_CULSO